jgi:hypothetical protein
MSDVAIWEERVARLTAERDEALADNSRAWTMAHEALAERDAARVAGEDAVRCAADMSTTAHEYERRLRVCQDEAASMKAILTAERDEARANYRFMVERAADQKLDGYRELGARAAAAEQERDEARAECERHRIFTREAGELLHSSAVKWMAEQRAIIAPLQAEIVALREALRSRCVTKIGRTYHCYDCGSEWNILDPEWHNAGCLATPTP